MQLMQSPITFALIAITVLISWQAFKNKELLNKLLFNPYNVKTLDQKWRFLTHGFIHGDMMHLGVNMYVFYMFGQTVEATFIHDYGMLKGEIFFIVLYLGAIIFAPLAAYKKHQDNPYYNSLGASGATSAVLIVFMIMYPGAPLTLIFLPFFDLPAIVFGFLFFAYESYMNKKGGTGVAHDAHLLGALFGMGFLAIINIEYYYSLVDFVTSFFA